LTKAEEFDIMDTNGGYSGEKMGDTDKMTTITDIRPIDFNDRAAIKKEIEAFAKKYAYADVEHALEISPNGNAYSLIGTKYNVNSELLGKDVLKGGISIHNHIVSTGETMGDSFSIEDLMFAAANNAGKQCLVSGERRESFHFAKSYAANEIHDAWRNAKHIMVDKSEKGEINIIWEQEEIIKILNDVLEGFNFYGKF
jgi:hypothetical protein